MDINSATQNQISSVKHAIGTASLQQAMSRDGATVSKLLEGMEETSQAVQEARNSTLPHLGNNINVRV